MSQAKQLIQQLSLEPHPEGGFYKRIYESQTLLETENGSRPLSTSIHYLLERDDFSAWHRIKSDELWYFHQGAPLTIHMLDKVGTLESKILSAETPHICVPAHTWFSAENSNNKVDKENETPNEQYSLVSCVVTPGFDFADFEMADRETLSEHYPLHKAIISRLCRE